MKKFLTVIFILAFFLTAAPRVQAYLRLDGKYPNCHTTCIGTKPDDCYNGPTNTNSGGCGTACGVGDAWSHYSAACKNVAKPDNPEYCEYVWVKAADKVCSTGDKCISGEKGLRAGSCDCSYGGLYKTCCKGNKAVKCVKASSALQDTSYPDEGVCPSGSTTVRCSGNICGTDADCQSGTSNPTPTPTGSPSGGHCPGAVSSWTYNNGSWCTSSKTCNAVISCDSCTDVHCGGNSTCRTGSQSGSGYCSNSSDVRCYTCTDPNPLPPSAPTPTPVVANCAGPTIAPTRPVQNGSWVVGTAPRRFCPHPPQTPPSPTRGRGRGGRAAFIFSWHREMVQESLPNAIF